MNSTSFRASQACLAAAAVVFAAGCRGPALTATSLSMPAAGGEPARLVVKVEQQPVLTRFDPFFVDHLQWSEHDGGQAPPNPLVELPLGPKPEAAWVLRARRRGSTALVPVAYLAVRDAPGARHLIYVTQTDAARFEPGTAFELQGDLTVRVSNPTAPPPASEAPVDYLGPAEAK